MPELIEDARRQLHPQNGAAAQRRPPPLTVGVKSGDVADLIAAGQPVKVEHHTVEALVSTDPAARSGCSLATPPALDRLPHLMAHCGLAACGVPTVPTPKVPNMTASPASIVAGGRRTATVPDQSVGTVVDAHPHDVARPIMKSAVSLDLISARLRRLGADCSSPPGANVDRELVAS